MVNKERRFKRIQRARSVILGAGIAEGLVALLGAVQAMMTGSVAGYISTIVYLALAVFFVLFRHPAFGIAYTVFYALERVAVLFRFQMLFQEMGCMPGTGVALTTGVALGVVLAGGLLVLFIYADYQAVVLRRLERSREEE